MTSAPNPAPRPHRPLVVPDLDDHVGDQGADDSAARADRSAALFLDQPDLRPSVSAVGADWLATLWSPDAPEARTAAAATLVAIAAAIEADPAGTAAALRSGLLAGAGSPAATLERAALIAEVLAAGAPDTVASTWRTHAATLRRTRVG